MADKPFRMDTPYCHYNIPAPVSLYPSGSLHCARPAVAIWRYPDRDFPVCAKHDKVMSKVFPNSWKNSPSGKAVCDAG